MQQYVGKYYAQTVYGFMYLNCWFGIMIYFYSDASHLLILISEVNILRIFIAFKIIVSKRDALELKGKTKVEIFVLTVVHF